MRIGKNSVCYFCGEPATTTEHVPPQSFFPEDDEARGTSLRRNLITVPSCNLHNNGKNEIDEKIRNIIGMILSRNSAGDANSQKVIDSLMIKGFEKFLAQCIPVIATKHGKTVQTGAYVLTNEEKASLMYGLECIARGLWYWKHKEYLSKSPTVTWIPDNIHIPDPPNGWQGDNPQVFRFNFVETMDRQFIVFCFYESFTVVAEIFS